MATSPENPQSSRAPPSSPVAAGRRSSVTNDHDLSEFLEHSLRVPDLNLPDRIFPRQILIENPPEIDFQSLISLENDSVLKFLESIAAIGCFQLVNHGISRDLIRSVSTTAAGIFWISPENKAIASRSPGKHYGFEEFHGEEETEMNEEFVWCSGDEGLKSVMEGIWPDGYSNFSEKMESLSTEIEKVAGKVLLVLLEKTLGNSTNGNGLIEGQDLFGSICCLYRHCRNAPANRWASSMRYDIIGMLIRGAEYSHALCVHVCDGSSEFHAYSKKGWISFCANKDAIVVTIGDRIQAWSGGQYKHVIGRPIFKVEDEDSISMAFLYSPPSITKSFKEFKGNREKTVSLGQQAILAVAFTLIYHFLVYIYSKF
ncbi:hypothetical protein HHK36_014196 [Tetracentron sinense]|uniref:Non-haem dioxygenase N-terminal domain-containing protein n=1 Tax=Tetracentron sinense TaxID=13715 RepID=A0A835DE10_TETSI|nr:hypothetical protein HHK36_014196 [Tetracentron sinense]